MNRRTAMIATGAALASAALPPAPALAQGASGSHRVPVGALEAFVVTDGFNVRPDATQGLVVNATPAQVTAAMQAAGMTPPSMQNPYNITAVKTPRGVVLVDAGTGGIAGPQSGRVPANLRAIGIEPAQVTLIIHTHFHGDHIGGLTDAQGVAQFPNAEIAVPEGEWAYWMDEGEASRAPEGRRPAFANARRRFAPYMAKVRRFAPGATIAPGFTAVASNGHAPGHTSILVADGATQLLVIGDAITTPAFFLPNPEWYPGFDMDPAMAVATRRALLDRAAADRLQIVGYHFPMPATGRVERSGSGFRLVPAA
jgi:glyoxylase-like metal-dependent hydrolase (beta-lactamase superfamily II)